MLKHNLREWPTIRYYAAAISSLEHGRFIADNHNVGLRLVAAVFENLDVMGFRLAT